MEQATHDKLEFHLEVYSGPLDLLLSLITRQKLNIYDIPIALILDQYLDYIEDMQKRDAELESSFLVMACELLYIKSRMLLPKDEDEEDPRAELVTTLIEYSKIRFAADFLEKRGIDYFYRFPSKPQPYQLVRETEEMAPEDLYLALKNLRIAVKEERERRKKEDVTGIFSEKVVPVEEKVLYVLRRLKQSIGYGNAVSLHALLKSSHSRSEMVATFLAALSLTSSGRVRFVKVNGDYVLSLNEKKRA